MSAHLSSYPNNPVVSLSNNALLVSINMTYVPHWRRQRWEKYTCRPTRTPVCQPRCMCEHKDTHLHADNERLLSGTLGTQTNSPGSDTLRRKSFNGSNGGQRADYCFRKKQWAATLSCGVLVKQQAGTFQDKCQKQRSGRESAESRKSLRKTQLCFFSSFSTARKTIMTLQNPGHNYIAENKLDCRKLHFTQVLLCKPLW